MLLKGDVLKQPGRIAYRVVVRDADSMPYLPGQEVGLTPEEALLARADGSIKIVKSEAEEEATGLSPSETKAILEQFFQQEEELWKEKGWDRSDSEYRKKMIERLKAFVGPWAEVVIPQGEGGQGVITIRPKPTTLKENIQAARAEIKEGLKRRTQVVPLMPEERETWGARFERRFLTLLAVGGIFALAAALLLGAYRTLRQGWAIARHQARLRTGQTGIPPGVVEHPQGVVTRAYTLAATWVVFVAGIGARFKKRWTHRHPEQGKVSRAMEVRYQPRHR